VTEALIQAAVKSLAATRTLIVIAHRLSTIRNADRIYVLDGGRVVDTGTHSELMARSGRYAEMHAVQQG
jgi:ABC-type multidrug transport system fused ATPase/permease subunit